MANWPPIMAAATDTRQGNVAFDPKCWIDAAAPNRKPIDRIGPQPVL